MELNALIIGTRKVKLIVCSSEAYFEEIINNFISEHQECRIHFSSTETTYEALIEYVEER